jgi:hypothetical protein
MSGSTSSQHGSVALGASAHFFNPGIEGVDGGGGLGDGEICKTIETPAENDAAHPDSV